MADLSDSREPVALLVEPVLQNAIELAMSIFKSMTVLRAGIRDMRVVVKSEQTAAHRLTSEPVDLTT